MKCFNCEGPHFRRDCPNIHVNGQHSVGGNGGFRGRGGFRGGFRGRGSWVNSRGFRGRGFGHWNRGQWHGGNMSNGNAQMAGVHRLAVVDESLHEVMRERDCEFAPDLERLVDLYDREIVSVDSVKCNTDILLSSPEKVTISLHGSKVEAIVDSGAQITCVHSKFVPDHLLHGKDQRFITLEGAFRDRHVSKVVEMPCVLWKGRDRPTSLGNEIWITCAVSDKLSSDCLLSLRDYKDLSEFADAFIPQVKMVTGTDLITETDEMGMSELDAVSVLPMYQCLGSVDLVGGTNGDVMNDKNAVQSDVDLGPVSVNVGDVLHNATVLNADTLHSSVHVGCDLHDISVLSVGKKENDLTAALLHDAIDIDMKMLQGADESLRIILSSGGGPGIGLHHKR